MAPYVVPHRSVGSSSADGRPERVANRMNDAGLDRGRRPHVPDHLRRLPNVVQIRDHTPGRYVQSLELNKRCSRSTDSSSLVISAGERVFVGRVGLEPTTNGL